MAAEDLTGRTLGDFVVRHRIGEGGFGAVYRAEQAVLGREAVIKVLHGRHRSTKTVNQRFLREAQLASKLDHPYAAHIYAFGVETDGLMWIAMEYVRGQTLHDVLRERGTMPLEELVPLLDRICEVLQAAHDLGIIHRDIKPPNVMVVQRAGRVFPKLLDFGIAKLEIDEPERKPTFVRLPDVSAIENTVSFVGVPGHQSEGLAETLQTGPISEAKQAALTEAGTLVGSPPYMAPEQWEDSAAATSRTDLYALGVLMYEVLTGRRPFAASNSFALALAHARAPVPPLGGTLPVALDAVIGKVLSKKAGDRYGSAMELAQAFRTAAGFGTQPLPLIDDDLRQIVEASFPQPIAEAVAAFHAARNAHQGRDALRDVAATAIRYLASIALATQAQVRIEAGSAAIADTMRVLRRRALSNLEWLNLARELAATMRTRRNAHPMPELVTLLEADGDSGPLASVVQERTGEPDPLIAIVDLLPAITQMLRAITFLADYPLVVVAEGRAESWMGVRRPRRIAIEVIGRAIENAQPTLVDTRGRPAVALWPIVQASSPMPGAAPELFMLDGGGRRGARLVAMPNALERQDEAVWDWLSERFADQDHVPSSALDAKPYRGLSAYTTLDADAFVGREREIDAAINRLSTSSLVAVVGPSGAGKSSFVHAGIVPSLPTGTTVISVRPGASPLAVLEKHLAGVRDTSAVLVVDQFEELFTLGADLEERRAYVRTLLEATRANVRVILTLRDDFLARATQMPELRERLSASLFLLGTPTRVDLVRILRQPLAQHGFDFDEPALPERMVDDVADTPGALALLSFAAGKLWDLRDRHFRQLTRKAYDALGGVAGALAQHAETTLANMTPHEQQLARTTLRHLVTAEGTRAILTTKELDQLLRDPAAATVLEKLIAARLLVSTEADSGDDRIEIVHEALIAAWPRLETWRREDAEGARLRDQVRAAARQWIERDKPSGLLWRDDALAELKVWRARHPQPLTDADEAFVAASFGEARRRTWVRRALVAIAIAVTAVFVVMTWRANVSAQHSARVADEATLDARTKLRDSLFEEGRLRMLEGDKQKALVPLEKARAMGENGPGINFMIAVAKRATLGKLFTLHGHTARLWDVAVNGSQIATASADGTVRLWTDAGAPIATLEHGGAVTSIAFSPDGALLAGGGRGGNVQIWRIADRREVAAFAIAGRVNVVAFSPDGARVLATSEDDAPIVFDVASHITTKLPGHNGSADGAYCSGGSCLVTWDEHGRVVVWDARTLVEMRHYDLGKELLAGAVDADGSLIVLGATNGELMFLGRDRPMVDIDTAHDNNVFAIAISPRGDAVATAGGDRTARLWTPSGKLVASLVGHRAQISDVRFSPRADIVATTSADGSARLWGAHSGLLLGEADGHAGSVDRVAFDASGAHFVTASSDHDAIIWDVGQAMQFRQLPLARVDTSSNISSIRYAPSGVIVALTEPAGSIAIVDALTGAVRCTTAIAGSNFAWSRDASLIASIDDGGHVVRIWDARTCALVRELPDHGKVRGLDFDGEGKLLTGGGNVVRRWSVEGRLLATSTVYPGNLTGLAVDGTTVIATTSGASDVVLQDSDLNSSPRVYRSGSEQELTGIYRDKPRHRILASGFEPYVWLWNEGRPEPIGKLEATGPLWNVVQSADSRSIIAIGGVNPSLWTTTTLQPLGVLDGHTDLAVGGGLTASGLLITVSRDKTARVWDVDKRRALMTIPGAQSIAIDASGTSITFADTTGSRSWSMPN